jgi:hypothetical protein
MSLKYRIGYVDENEEQVKLYRRKLKEYDFEVVGYKFEIGMSPEMLMEQIFKSDIDLLMIDFKLNESNIVSFNGEVIENFIYDKKPLFPHIIFTNKVDQAEPFVEDWKIIFDKDDIFLDDEDDKTGVERFVTMLKKSIEQYKNHINSKKKILSDLLEKSKIEELSAIDKNNILAVQEELNILDKTKPSEVPKQLLLNENIESINNLRMEAEEFLQSLIQKRKNK